MSHVTPGDRTPSAEHVRLDVEDGVAVLRLDRPKLNALDAAMQRRIGVLAVECAERSDVAAVVLTGGEHVFAAGADVKEMEKLAHADMVAHSGVLQAAFTAVARIPKPVVAAVNGYALGGGCELALCADVRIAADDATFGQPEIKLGVIPGAGGTQRLSRLVGPSRAKELVLPTALAWARQFVGGPALALRAAKECVDRGSEVDLETGLEIERMQFAALFATEDRAAGMRSFVEHGPGQARFSGR